MKYLVTPAPHKHKRMSANDMYIYVFISLAVCFMFGVVNYKLSALIVMATCFGATVVLELIIASIKNKRFMLQDASCFVTGMTLACVMPINMPWYFGLLAAAIAVAVKYLFGGLGNNIFNSSALSRSVVGCLFAGFSFNFFGESQTVLQTVLTGDKSALVMQDILMGNTPGAIGTCCILMILIAAVILMIMQIVRWENLLFAAVGFITIIWVTMGAQFIIPMLCSGSFIFVSVFMLNDPTTSPYGFSARSIYALLFGVLAALMMSNNILGETAVFLALLIANFVAPALDTIFSVCKRGVKNNA